MFLWIFIFLAPCAFTHLQSDQQATQVVIAVCYDKTLWIGVAFFIFWDNYILIDFQIIKRIHLRTSFTCRPLYPVFGKNDCSEVGSRGQVRKEAGPTTPTSTIRLRLRQSTQGPRLPLRQRPGRRQQWRIHQRDSDWWYSPWFFLRLLGIHGSGQLQQTLEML